jgi:hypothetical protein
LNKKDILNDFTVYLLLFGDEIRDNELRFFQYPATNGTDYKSYLEVIKKFVDTDITDTVTEINILDDIISKKEIEILQDYIKNEFSFGYPNEINEDGFAWGESYNLDFSIEEIKSYFKEYLQLRKLNTHHYITYYLQYVNYTCCAFRLN